MGLGDVEFARLKLTANKPELQRLLKYHVVPSSIKAGDLEAGQTQATLAPQWSGGPATPGDEAELVIKKGGDPEKVTVNDAEVTMADVMASNGVVHIVNAVILYRSILKLAQDTPSLSRFAALVVASGGEEGEGGGLTALLSNFGGFTVFAPSDDAWPDAEFERLKLPANKAELQNLLKYHVTSSNEGVRGRILSTALQPSQVVVTIFNPPPFTAPKKLTITVENGDVKVGPTAKVTTADVGAANGVVHVIDAVLSVPTTAVLAIV